MVYHQNRPTGWVSSNALDNGARLDKHLGLLRSEPTHSLQINYLYCVSVLRTNNEVHRGASLVH